MLLDCIIEITVSKIARVPSLFSKFLKLRAKPWLPRLPLFKSVKRDVPDQRSRISQSGHFVSIPFPLSADRCSLFAVFLWPFCKEHAAENPLGPCHRLHGPLGRELDAPCRSRGAASPKNGAELAFSIFAWTSQPVVRICQSRTLRGDWNEAS